MPKKPRKVGQYHATNVYNVSVHFILNWMIEVWSEQQQKIVNSCDKLTVHFGHCVTNWLCMFYHVM